MSGVDHAALRAKAEEAVAAGCDQEGTYYGPLSAMVDPLALTILALLDEIEQLRAADAGVRALHDWVRARALYESARRPDSVPWAALVGPFRSDLLGDARAVLDLLGEAKAVLWDEGAEATAEWMANNPGPSGIPHDPPHNPYRKDT